MIVSTHAYLWIALIATAGVAGWWTIVDAFRLSRALREQPRSPAVRDRIFGSLIGMATGIIGVAGMVIYYLHGNLR